MEQILQQLTVDQIFEEFLVCYEREGAYMSPFLRRVSHLNPGQAPLNQFL